MTASATERFITQTEAARRLQVPRSSMSRLIASGDLKVRKGPTGIKAIVLVSSVEALLARMLDDDQQRAG